MLGGALSTSRKTYPAQEIAKTLTGLAEADTREAAKEFLHRPSFTLLQIPLTISIGALATAATLRPCALASPLVPRNPRLRDSS